MRVLFVIYWLRKSVTDSGLGGYKGVYSKKALSEFYSKCTLTYLFLYLFNRTDWSNLKINQGKKINAGLFRSLKKHLNYFDFFIQINNDLKSF